MRGESGVAGEVEAGFFGAQGVFAAVAAGGFGGDFSARINELSFSFAAFFKEADGVSSISTF